LNWQNSFSINPDMKKLSKGILMFALALFIVMILSWQDHRSNILMPSLFHGNEDSVIKKFQFINTAFENASQVNWEIDSNGVINIGLIYDHERSSPNRAANHWYFQIQAEAGSDLTLVLKNFDNIWNGQKAYPVSDRTSCIVSENGTDWTPISTELITGNRLKFRVHMKSDRLYIASVEPYTLTDLEKFKREISVNPLVKINTIGKTVEGRPLEMIRVGHPNAPYKTLIRARAHAWEPGGNWVVQGLIRSLLQRDAKHYLDKYCVYIMPMANKDAVVRGRSRFNILGKDLNRNWDQPADSIYAPENYALELWLKNMIRKGQKPDLAIDLHNDSNGHLHISRPNVNLAKYLENMKRLETLLYKYTWFREGPTGGDFRNPGSFGEGLLERYRIDACIYELNYEWIAGLNKVPLGKDWELLGKQLSNVFLNYFNHQQ
jgi:hypothetical protein